jgi:hypothetical protein
MPNARASAIVANALDEVIIFRATGPWSQRWIKQSYPTKNFHVTGKSSDWGTQAGFVPYSASTARSGTATESPTKARPPTMMDSTVPDSADFFLFARRSGDQKEFAFRLKHT